jgi:hypothetical protein
MKDQLGHGSEAGRGTGAHTQGVQATPQLQRRHFEAIAADLKAAPDAGSPAHAARVSDMANKLSTTNPGFRRDFFVAAATPGGKYNNKTNKSSRADVQKKAVKFTGGSAKWPGAQPGTYPKFGK